MKLRCLAAVILLVFAGACGSISENDSPVGTPSSAAALAQMPVIVGPESVAGWWNGTDWMEAVERLKDVPAKDGDTYKLLGLETSQTVNGTAPKPGCEIVTGSVQIEIPGLKRNFSSGQAPPIAVSFVDNPKPRAVEVLNSDAQLYKEAAGLLLKERSIEDPNPTVVEVIKADLDADGTDEVIVVAERLADQEGLLAQIGDYSLVFLRRVVDGKPVTTVISESIPTPKPGETPFVLSHRISAVADLNGDGKMELALSQRYYEGAAVVFHELKPDGSFPEVLGSGCGA